MASPKTSKTYLFGEIHTGMYLQVALKKGSSLTPVATAKAHENGSVELLWARKDDGKRGAKQDIFRSPKG
jgi:hypothetical protein